MQAKTLAFATAISADDEREGLNACPEDAFPRFPDDSRHVP